MPLNRALLGKTYPSTESWTVEAQATKAYALATNTENPWYLDEKRAGGLVAPPLYGVVFQFPTLLQPLMDQELGVNFMRLVHAEQDMRFLAPVRPGDVIQTVSKVHSIADKTSGELLEISLESTNQKGQKVLDVLNAVFIRGRTRRDSARSEDDARKKEEVPPQGKLVLDVVVHAAADQSLRYADASGDHNPIHKDPEMARAAGLPDIILHGLCSMAFVQNAVVDKLCGSDPTRLQRLKVRFAKPVLNGEALSIKGWQQEDGTVALEVYNPQGVTVLKGGLAEVAG